MTEARPESVASGARWRRSPPTARTSGTRTASRSTSPGSRAPADALPAVARRPRTEAASAPDAARGRDGWLHEMADPGERLLARGDSGDVGCSVPTAAPCRRRPRANARRSPTPFGCCRRGALIVDGVADRGRSRRPRRPQGARGGARRRGPDRARLLPVRPPLRSTATI